MVFKMDDKSKGFPSDLERIWTASAKLEAIIEVSKTLFALGRICDVANVTEF